MQIHILGYGPITERLYSELRKISKVSIYSSVQVHLDQNLAKKYDELLKIKISPDDVFIVAWRELPLSGEIKYNVLRHLEESLSDRNVLIYLSSVAVYGQSEQICTEETPPVPINNYGKTKLQLEVFFEHHFRSKLCFLRISNVFGHHGFNDVVNKIVKAAVNDSSIDLVEPLLIYRDFIFIDRVVKAIRDMSTGFTSNKQLEIYNLSSGKSISLLDVLHIIEGNLDKKIMVNHKQVDSETIKRSFVSNHRFLRYMNLVDQVVADQIAMYIKNFDQSNLEEIHSL
jgi:nucleoside-diphosphate-sugar epimerase